MKEYKDKINIKEKIKNKDKIILNFGSGDKNKKEGVINIDILDLNETDIVANLENGLTFLPDNSVDEIHATSFLEHINNLDFLMEEIYRVLKPNGILNAFVPHFSNPYFYSDPTHKRFFGLYTFYYFSKGHGLMRRKVPKFYNKCDFKITKQKLIFRSKIIEKIINSRYRVQEWYERNIPFLVPCYGIDIDLKAIK